MAVRIIIDPWDSGRKLMELDIVALSRLQFAMTALYHFLFVPLTLGLSVLLAIMETTYVMTGRQVWRQMTKFWGTLFGINFVLGVATGLVMEFQFGMNWSYYSYYVGDIFGAPLAIEGLLFGGDLRRAVLLWLGKTLKGRPSKRHLGSRARLEFLGPVDLDCQWLDAEPCWIGPQPPDDAHGSHQLL
jgi:hypothetical protein